MLGWEALWPRLAPVLGVVALGAILALLEIPAHLPGWAHALLLLGWLGALGWVGWRAALGFRWPGPEAADRRLEADSNLPHRPLETLADRPTGHDPMALALWQAHQRRASALLARLRLRPPAPGLAARDPRALRAAVIVGLVMALGVAGGDAPQRLWRGLLPQFGAAVPAAALRVEAWVTPPTYTGAAPIFLPPEGGAARVPAGSRVQLAVSGGGGAVPELLAEAAATPFQRLDAGSFSAEAALEQDVTLAIRREGRELARWRITLQPDAPPKAEFAEAPGRTQRGLAIRLPWKAEDDWGLASVQAEIRLAARAQAAPISLEMGLPAGRPRSARGVAQPDLSAHPWAGLEVVVQLVARDGAGQQGVSDAVTLTLPERSFNHPVAKLIIAVRRGLSLDPGARQAARQALEAIAGQPEAFEHDTTTYLALRHARTRLMVDRRPEAVEEVQGLLWDAAVALEEGRDGRTQRALAQAEEAVREALREAERNPEDAQKRAEAQRRIEELREAIRRHLEALAERAQRETTEAPLTDPRQRQAEQRQIDRRTRRMEQAAREGRNQDAERELAELEEMLKALEEGRQTPQQNAERQQRRERGQQNQGVVQDMVRRETEMLDRGHQRAEAEERRRAEERRQQLRQRQMTPRWQEPPAPQPNAGAQEAERQAEAERQQDARRQRALRRALGEVMQQFGDLTGEVPEALGRADQAMREAQEALAEGQDARDAQQRALRALMEGGRQMAQQMQRQFGQSQPGEDDGEGEDMAGDQPGGGDGDSEQQLGEGRDPLGRRTRDVNGTADQGADTRVPDEAEQLRTRRIQEELRRREADKQRPMEELDYIERLLKRF